MQVNVGRRRSGRLLKTWIKIAREDHLNLEDCVVWRAKIEVANPNNVRKELGKWYDVLKWLSNEISDLMIIYGHIIRKLFEYIMQEASTIHIEFIPSV